MTLAGRVRGRARKNPRRSPVTLKSTGSNDARRLTLAAIALLVMASVSWDAKAASGDEADVRSSWERYRTAILAQDADAAYALIDRTTREYYRELLQVVLFASPEDMAGLMIMVKLAVVQSRREIPREQLLDFDAEAYFKHSVGRGWFSRDTMRRLTLVAIEVDGDRARSSVERDGRVVRSGYEFNREDGAWKINLMPALIAGEWAMQQIVTASGKAEDDFIFDLVEAHSGTRPDASIWEPIVSP